MFILSGKVSTNSTIAGINSTNPASADSPKNLNIGLSNNPPALILGLPSFGPVNLLPVPADANDAFLCSFLSLSFSLNAFFLSSTISF